MASLFASGDLDKNKYITASLVSGLENTLRSRLHGQPLVHRAIVRAVKDHLQNPSPKKALVLSFHGWTGGGKNYASSMVADALYENGMNSKYVTLYVSTKHFPHQDEVPKYRVSFITSVPSHSPYVSEYRPHAARTRAHVHIISHMHDFTLWRHAAHISCKPALVPLLAANFI